jgi:hypothetical protein
VPGATHAPHHPTPEWIKKIGDMHLFDDGWNKVRETIFANQKRLGDHAGNSPLELSTKRPPDVITGYNWELYNVQEDPTEYNDLATKMPGKLKEMQDLFH